MHPQRSIITRALGVDSSVEVDVYPVELVPGDRLLLCSDGLTGMVQPDDIAADAAGASPIPRAAAQLVDAANSAGGEDNITVVVVAVTDEAPLREVPEPVEPIVAVEVDDDARTRARRAAPARRARRRPGAAVGAADRPGARHRGGRGRLVRAQGLLRGHQPGAGHRVQGRPRRPRGLGSRPSSSAPTVAMADLKPAAQAQVRDHQTFSSRADAARVRRAG